MLLRSCLDSLLKQTFLPRQCLTFATRSTSDSSIPTPPKRAKTAWVFYFSEHFPRLKKEFPTAPKSEIFDKLSENWRNMDESVLAKYRELAETDQKKYRRDMETYKANLTEADKLAVALHKAQEAKGKSRSSQMKQLKALGMPKKPLNAYILFSMDYSKKNLEHPREVFKESARISTAWAKLPPDEKAKWTALAAAKEKEYRENLEKWEKEMIKQGHLEIIRMEKK